MAYKAKDQWLTEGDYYYANKQYSNALTAYEQAIRLDPDDAFVYINKGYTLFHLNQYPEALTTFERAIHLDPNPAIFYINKAEVLNKLNRHIEAHFTSLQVIQVDSNDPFFLTDENFDQKIKDDCLFVKELNVIDTN